MISANCESEILRLLHSGRHSYRQIARLAGVSRGTVGGLAHGGPRPRNGASHPAEELGLPTVPKHRCAGCGHDVIYDPCQICIARVARARNGGPA